MFCFKKRSLIWTVCLIWINVGSYGCQSKQLADFEPRERSIMKAPSLHSDELNHLIQNDTQSFNIFINFHAPWCSECKNLEESWNELSREFDFVEGVRVVSVDCTGTGERACITHNIRSYPHMLEVKSSSFQHADSLSSSLSSSNEVQREYNSYWGERTYVGLKRWIVESVPSLKISLEFYDEEKNQFKSFNEKQRSYAIRPVLHANNDSIRCAAWRGSEDCDPEGVHDPSRDLSCFQEVLGNRAGYCDCGGKFTKLTDCGHEHRKGFTCLDVCDPVDESKCKGWKATKDCYSSMKVVVDATYARQHGVFIPKPPIRDNHNDMECRDIISSDWSGYCDCGDSIELHFNCTHEPFTCETKCNDHHVLKWNERKEEIFLKAEQRRQRIQVMKEAKVISIEEEEEALKREQEILQYRREAQLKLDAEVKVMGELLDTEAEQAALKEAEMLKQQYIQHEIKMKNSQSK
jgi:thiol-disulfide isomerase/thioredoxin